MNPSEYAQKSLEYSCIVCKSCVHVFWMCHVCTARRVCIGVALNSAGAISYTLTSNVCGVAACLMDMLMRVSTLSFPVD